MPDELTPEQTEATVDLTPVDVPASTVDAEPVKVADDDPDREPGGDDPQAVRARKEYRQRKKMELELRAEREARIAAEARAEAIKETAPRPEKASAPRAYSMQEIQAAVDAGTISPVEAADYLAKQRAEEVASRVLNEERTRVDVESRHSTALTQVKAYAELAPWITDRTDSRFAQLDSEYRKLTDPNGLYRLPQSPATDLLVLEQVLGPITKLRKKSEVVVQRDTHTEAGAGGNGTQFKPGAGNGVLAKAPKNLVDFWDRTGTIQKDREAELKIWEQREARRKSA